MIIFFKNLIEITPKKNFFKIFLVLVGNQVASILEVAGLGLIPIIGFYLINPEKIVSILTEKNIYFLNEFILSENFILISVLLLCLFFILKNILNILIGYFATSVKVNIYKEISNRFFNDFINANYEYFLTKDNSFIFSFFNNEIKAASEIIELTINFLRDLFTILIISILLLAINFKLSLTLILFFLIISLIVNQLSKKFSLKQGKISLKQRLANVKLLNQTFDLIRDAKILQKENFFIKIFDEQVKLIGNHKIYNNLINLIPRPILESFIIITVGLIILYSNYYNQLESSIVLISFLGVSSVKLIPTIKSLSNSYNGINFNMHSFELVSSEIQKIKFYSDNKKVSKKKINLFKFENNINIKNLCFSYTRNDFSINNWNFEIKKNEKIGIAGGSGTGKTSFINILLGLLKPTSGEVLIDGNNLNENIKDWYNMISFVPQDIYLINDSIKKNIAIGAKDSDININLINKLLEIVNLKEFVLNLPDGINTNLENRGLNISGGQRQRIGIARALYKNPEILILDEATSALDEMNQKIIMNNLNEIKNLTVILVSHQLNLFKDFDKVVLIENKKIKVYDSFDKLIKKN